MSRFFPLPALAFAAGCQHARGVVQAPIAAQPSSAAATPSLSLPSHLRVVSTDALSLWKRTLLAARAAPGVVSVVETRFLRPGAEPVVAKFSVVETEGKRRGQAAGYRLTYTAPALMKDVVILNDGRSVWRYDARKRLIARRASLSAPIPPELEEGIAAIPIQSDGAHPEIEVGIERVAGRPTEVLALRTRRSGRIVERRWVDTGSGRTLRLEQYAGRDAHIVRRIEISEMHLLRTPREIAWAAQQITPSFPDNVPIVESGASHARHIAEAEDTAGRLRLPLHVRGFALQSVEPTSATNAAAMRPLGAANAFAAAHQNDLSALVSNSAPACDAGGGAASTPARAVHMTQLYYGKGTQGISVFVSPPPAAHMTAAAASELVASPGWSPASLGGRRLGFARASTSGAAVAWTGAEGGSYIAVSRMPLADLLPIAQAFAANRDDAPAFLANSR